MKYFFTRTCTKIGRFFWSWGFLKFILWTVTLIVLLYVEENWRGARTWAATKAEWEAKGESFDYNKFIPPPIPDDQNLAAISLFKLEPIQGAEGIHPVVLGRAVRTGQGPGNDLPSRGNWMRGELPDMGKIRSALAANYAAVFKGATPPQDAIEQFDALYPFLADLRISAATRPFFRLPVDYTVSPPASRPFVGLPKQIKLSQIVALHATLALDHHQYDLALEDIKINYVLLSGAKRDPTLVGGLVAIAMNSITEGAIYDGLAFHAWNDAQLVEIENTLEPINFLADYQFDFRGEAVESVANIEYFKHARPSDIHRIFGMLEQDVSLAPLPWANGWWDNNKSQMTTFLFSELTIVNPQARLVFPKVARDLQHQIEQTNARWDAYAPWNIWFTIGAPPYFDRTQKFSYEQVWVDEARIACALERFWLAHGAYPESLDALAPAYINELPHDIMTGHAYHYQLRPDGTFLLYSVGWNQTDDGGKTFYHKDNPKRIDETQGDWVWPTSRKN